MLRDGLARGGQAMLHRQPTADLEQCLTVPVGQLVQDGASRRVADGLEQVGVGVHRYSYRQAATCLSSYLGCGAASGPGLRRGSGPLPSAAVAMSAAAASRTLSSVRDGVAGTGLRCRAGRSRVIVLPEATRSDLAGSTPTSRDAFNRRGAGAGCPGEPGAAPAAASARPGGSTTTAVMPSKAEVCR